MPVKEKKRADPQQVTQTTNQFLHSKLVLRLRALRLASNFPIQLGEILLK
jgi:hypothetical protein